MGNSNERACGAGALAIVECLSEGRSNPMEMRYARLCLSAPLGVSRVGVSSTHSRKTLVTEIRIVVSSYRVRAFCGAKMRLAFAHPDDLSGTAPNPENSDGLALGFLRGPLTVTFISVWVGLACTICIGISAWRDLLSQLYDPETRYVESLRCSIDELSKVVLSFLNRDRSVWSITAWRTWFGGSCAEVRFIENLT